MQTLDRRLRDTATSILDTVFPPVCAECGRRGHWVCDLCQPTVKPLKDIACARCGAIWSARCVCAQLPDAVTAIASAMPFDGWVRAAIHAFKYQGERARGRHLGDMLLPLVDDDAEVDAVVPVPLHAARLRQRGFNQATLLSSRLARMRGDPPVLEIERRGSTTPQVGLAADQRGANVAGAFTVPRPDVFVGLRLLLIDDVVTTTATMTACARALADAGAVSVRCLSVARAVS